jgi:hypothetical protein
MLHRRVAKFKKAKAAARLKIVEECVEQIETGWLQDVEFDRETVDTVSALHSQIIGLF